MDISQFENVEFESSSTRTPQFANFARAYRSAIKKALPVGASIHSYHIGHFEVSGFIEKGGQLVYFSCSDVRYNPNEWLTHILIRTAKHDRDYTGGPNNYTSLGRLSVAIDSLLRNQEAPVSLHGPIL